MADFDGVIDPTAAWPDVPDLSITAVARGGPSGAMNAQALALAARIKLLVAAKASAVTAISDLRNIEKTRGPVVFVTGYYTSGDGGGGIYYLDSSDTSTADNGGTVIVAADNSRWKLQPNVRVTQKHFGAKGDYSDSATDAFNRWALYFMAGNVAANQHAPHAAAGVYKMTGAGWYIPVGDYMPNLTSDGAEQVCLKGNIPVLVTIEATGGSGQIPTVEWGGFKLDGVTAGSNDLIRVKGVCCFTGRGWHFYRAAVAVHYINEKAGAFSEWVVFDDAYVDTSVVSGEQFSKVSGDGSFRSCGFRNFKWNFSGAGFGVIIDAGCVPYMGFLSGTLWNYGANSIFIRNNSSQVPFIGTIDTETQVSPSNKLTFADPAGSGYTFLNGSLLGWNYGSNNLTLGKAVLTSAYLNTNDGNGQMFQADVTSGRIVSTAAGQRFKVPLVPGVGKNFLQWSAIITMNVTSANGYYWSGMYTVRNGATDNIINISPMAGNGILNNAGAYGAIVESQGNDYTAWFDNANLPAGSQLAWSVKYLYGMLPN